MNYERIVEKDIPHSPMGIVATIIIELAFLFILGLILDYIITRDINESLSFAARSTFVILVLDVIIYFWKGKVGVMGMKIFK